MKLAPLLLLPLLTSPVMAESIGDRSNRQAYEDAQTVNWNPEPEYIPSINRRRENWFTKTYHQEENYKRNNWWWQKHLATNNYQPGYSSSSTCTRKEYREEYVPGTSHRPGYVRTWHDEVEVPCRPSYRPSPPRERIPSPDGNECSEGAILGGILGGGAGAALSQGDGRWWAIPLGVVAGSVVGCDIDGG